MRKKMRLTRKSVPVLATAMCVVAAMTAQTIAGQEQTAAAKGQERSWLPGDHHIHSEWSVGWDDSKTPPAPIRGGDAVYPISTNAQMAKKYGLQWMVSTDHG